jgi:hypothetical protein
MNSPYITAVYLTPDQIEQPVDQFYRATRARALRSSEVQFADKPLPHQQAHAGFKLGREGIRTLGVPGGSLIVIDGWPSQAVADETFSERIRPALGHAPDPAAISSLELIGCVFNPDVSGFQSRTARANILVWDELDVDPGAVHHIAAQHLYSQGQPLLQGSGVHYTFRVTHAGTPRRYTMISCGIWAGSRQLRSAMDDHIMPAFNAGFTAMHTKADHDTIPADALGIAVREGPETRYAAA